ncbi:MAG: hypothetical protein ABR583_13585 [Gaiellaceae bacterium]
MTLARQWDDIRRPLPDDRGDVRLLLRLEDDARAERANALLAPLMSGRSGSEVRFSCTRGIGPGEEAVRRFLARLDGERVHGTLELLSVTPVGEQGLEANASTTLDTARTTHARPPAQPLAPAWQDAVAALPPDWSDVYAEVELDSSDFLNRGALLMGPLNPTRDGERMAFRFRCARSFGYGASPGMVERCLEHLDAEGISGRFNLLRALSDTQPVYTQGPVWYVRGKAV